MKDQKLKMMRKMLQKKINFKIKQMLKLKELKMTKNKIQQIDLQYIIIIILKSLDPKEKKDKGLADLETGSTLYMSEFLDFN